MIYKSHDMFELSLLINTLLQYRWQHECVIIPDYMPPYPKENTKPRCVVMYVGKKGDETFLRHSNGPLTGTSWDCYGDDFLNPELALFELSKASPPHNVTGGLSSTYSKGYVEIKEGLYTHNNFLYPFFWSSICIHPNVIFRWLLNKLICIFDATPVDSVNP